MLVLMDMEWIELSGHFFCPTQISAMRVDSKWSCIDRFDALIKPYGKSRQKWEHMAYSGYQPEQFLTADSAPVVFMNLFRWLCEDDILCWWVDHPAIVFRSVIRKMLRRGVNHTMRTVYPAWSKEISDGHLMVGSPYRLAKDRSIPVPTVEHSSANDVEALRALLYASSTSQNAVNSSLVDWDIMDKASRQAALASQYMLLYDTQDKLLHKPDCPKIRYFSATQGYSAYQSCIQAKMTPCRCCKEEYQAENRRLAQEVIRKCRFNYTYEQGGTNFHRTGCIHAARIPYMQLRGSVYYQNCLDKGLQPCGWCKPSLKQQVITHSPAAAKETPEPAGWTATRALTRPEKVALRRHETAQKERRALIKDQREKTQTELHDEHVLTVTGYAFWNATGYQTFHLRHCKRLSRISDLNGFPRYQDAIRAGLTPCRECKPSQKYDIIKSVPIYQEKRENESAEVLDRLCEKHGYTHSCDGTRYFIETSIGKWRIDIATHPVDVHHINLATGKDTAHYHKQHRLFLSLQDTFEYIRRHDTALMDDIKAKDSQ